MVIWEKTPKEINSIYGYRTKRSTRNIDTWNYANKLCGKIMFVMGIITIPTIIVEAYYYGKELEAVSISVNIIVGIQLILMLSMIPFVEYSLNKNFDSDGKLLTR